MAYGKADTKVGNVLKWTGVVVLSLMFGAALLAAVGGAIYGLAYITSVAWHDGK